MHGKLVKIVTGTTIFSIVPVPVFPFPKCPREFPFPIPAGNGTGNAGKNRSRRTLPIKHFELTFLIFSELFSILSKEEEKGDSAER